MSENIKSIWLIDDDQTSNLHNKHLIESLNISDEVKIFVNGKDALDCLAAISSNKKAKYHSFPGIILVDMKMEVMDGITFLDHYNNLYEEIKDCTLVCMISASANAKEKDEVLKKYKIPLFLSKPLTKKIMEDIYNAMINMNCV